MSSAWSRLLAVMTIVYASGVLAQPTPNPPVASARSSDPQYESLIAKAVTEFNLGHWGEAKAFFMRAHELHPNARTLRSLGLTSYELRLYVDAIGYFRDALRSEEQPLTPQLREHVQQQLAEARSFVTRVQLTVEPDNAVVRVDGQQPVYEEDGTLLLDPGLHELAAHAADYESQVRTVTAHGAELIEIALSLGPLPSPGYEPEQVMLVDAPAPEAPLRAATPVPQAQRPAVDDSSLSAPQWVGIALGAAGVAAGGVALGFSLAALHENDVSKRSCPAATSCDAAGRDARKSALSHADVATVSAIAAGALVVSGAVCFLAASGGSERETASWHITPVASHQTAGLLMSGHF